MNLPNTIPDGDFSPLLTVVIVNYNAWNDVATLVDSLAKSPQVINGSCEVVVVDNASDDPIPPQLRAYRTGVRLIPRSENAGFAVGVNTGWKSSSSPWLLLLNPDVLAGNSLLASVIGRIKTYESHNQRTQPPGVVGYALRNQDGTRQPSVGTFPNLVRTVWEQLIPRSRRKYQAIWRTKPGSVDWVTGACMLVNGSMLKSLGGMDEEFFLYYEEVALCRAAQQAGWRVEYDPSVEVVHLRPLQNRLISPKMRVITRHSKLLYFRKHLPHWQFLGLCAVVAAEARIRRAWATLRRQTDEARSWLIVSQVERTLRQGTKLVGSDVLRIADSLPSNPAESSSTKASSGSLPTLRQPR